MRDSKKDYELEPLYQELLFLAHLQHDEPGHGSGVATGHGSESATGHGSEFGRELVGVLAEVVGWSGQDASEG
ncbi:MAG: hypothetical protein HC833_20820 [Leptolyngbyaceae cyanobacterium RM1_406_9]|nr:hypothetical protein [Leptolyngbyaceae cyanobacterium RM1_406_9]